MKTAIITGASAGLGHELTMAAANAFPDIECFWLIARRQEKLKEFFKLLPGKSVKIIAADLCDEASFTRLNDLLLSDKPNVKLLINNAGCGFLGNVGDGELADQTRMIDLNLRALTAVIHLVLPYMGGGSKIINISSIASFCPNPRMTVYSSTKAFVTSFSRGLGVEVKSRGITVTAVCPGPMDTEFLKAGKIEGNSKTFELLPYCDPRKTAQGAVKAAKAGKSVYTPRAFYKLYRVIAKITPQAIMVHFTKT